MSDLLPGWVCRECGVFTGTRKGATVCRICGADMPQPPLEGEELRLVALYSVLRQLSAENLAMLENLGATQARCTELLEEVRTLRAERRSAVTLYPLEHLGSGALDDDEAIDRIWFEASKIIARATK